MLPITGRAHGSLRVMGVALGLAASLSLLGTSVLAQGVVTLETPAPPGAQPSGSPAAAATPPSDPQEAMLAYVECMRDHGVDMPDPEFTADGGVIMRAGGEGDAPEQGLSGGPGDPAFDEAQEACGALIEGTVRDLDPEQQAEMQAQALAFAQCMREHGVDMPDPQFGPEGQVSIRIGGPDGPRIDADVMQAAQEACGGFMGRGAPAGPDDASGPDDGGSTEARPEPSAAIP
jgi:hypothetical protein